MNSPDLHPSSSSVRPSALILRLSALGDVIHTIPAVMRMREAFDIAWAVEAPYAELVEIVAGVRPVPLRMKPWGRSLVTSRREIGAALRAMRGSEVAVDFQGLIKSAALAWLSGARHRFGFDRDAIREKAAGIFLNRRIAVDTAQHVVDWNHQLAEAVLGARASGPQPPGASPGGLENGNAGAKEVIGRDARSLRAGRPRSEDGNWQAFAADPSKSLGTFTNRIVLLPGAGRPEKLWPADRFGEVARHFGDRALVVWGPGERELAEAIGAAMAPDTNLRELACLLANARCVVGGDTGPLHLAAAYGVPVVGLYGPTDPRRNGPYGQLDRTIDHFRTSKSMDTIAARDVIARIEEVMAR